MLPPESEMWNVVVQWLILDHKMDRAKACQSAHGFRDQGKLEKMYNVAQATPLAMTARS